MSISFDGLLDSLFSWFYEIFYYIGILLCRILGYMYELFRIFSGMSKVNYQGREQTLISVFFYNSKITTIYWGMAVIGIVLLIGFTILAVVRKAFDMGDKVQQPMGEILRKSFSAFIFIISMTFILGAAIDMTNVLLEQVTFVFDHESELEGDPTSITFTDSQYAAMARAFDTIGNYSMNQSYNSRYNINECFNEIRSDLQYLQSEKVFKFNYTQTNEDGEEIQSWQSVLADIARAHNLDTDQPLDEYDESLASAIKNAMTFVTVNKSHMTVLQTYTKEPEYETIYSVDFDVLFWLTGTTDAAKNSSYNGNAASYTDPVRGAYFYKTRDIYDLDDVETDFTLNIKKFNHVLIIIGAVLFIKEFFFLALNCVARIFNILMLYVIAPPFIATMPWDDGSKFKQWTVAFIVQSFAIFGTVIAIRLLLLFIPIVFAGDLTLFSNSVIDMLAKLLLVFGGVYAARNASSLLTGILAENAGMQSLHAADMKDTMMKGGFGQALGAAKGLATGTMSAAGSAVGGVLKGGGSAVGYAAGRVGTGISNKWNAWRGATHMQHLNDSLNGTGPDEGAWGRKASAFMDSDKQSVMDKYRMNEQQYNDKRNEINRMRGLSGGGSSAEPQNMNTNANRGAEAEE